MNETSLSSILNDSASGEKPGFSIIVPAYNGEKTLPDTLRSLFLLKHDFFEVLVIDDASTDKTAGIAHAAGARVVQLPENCGPATARNKGAQEAKYKTLLFTDSDVLVPNRLLDKLEEQFRKTKADAIQGTFSEVCPYANFFSQYKNLYNRFVLNSLPDWIDTTFTSVTAVRRDAFLKSGGFDEKIRTASIEDRTLGRNLCKNGFKILLDRTIEVIHNKKLTFWGFIKNQYRRSRDLAKFLLRCRIEEKANQEKKAKALDESGRFGTNSPSTMMRIPMVFTMLVLLVLSFYSPIFLLVIGFFLVSYLYLILPFESYLIKGRGIMFAGKGILANLFDALVSGLGILHGLFDYWVLKKKY